MFVTGARDELKTAYRPREDGRMDLLWLSLLFLVALAACVVAHRHLPFGISPGWEYGAPILEFYQYHHINSDFLSIGYSALCGMSMVVFHGMRGLVIANLSFYLAYVVMVWVILRQLGATAKQAFFIGLLFVFYPDMLASVNKIYHAIFTPLLLLLYVSVAIYLIRSKTDRRADVLMAVLLGVELACRSNMVLMVPITGFLMWKYGLPNWLLRTALQTVVGLVIVSGICVAVHGSVFWPRVGSYVLFSGSNEYTEHWLLTYYDETAEGTLVVAMKARGVPDAYHSWSAPDDLPNDHEVRNQSMTKLYTHEALKFMKGHPFTMVKLTGEKVFTFLRPDMWAQNKLKSFGGIMKILATFAVPLWVVLCFTVPQPKGDPSRWIVGLTLAAYVVPLFASVTAPRIRVGVDVLCFLDSAGMLLLWWRRRQLS